MKFPTLTLSISALMWAMFTLFGNTPPDLIWLSNSVLEKPWTMITTHFVHISGAHLFWNVMAFVILASIIEQSSKRTIVWSLAAGIAAVNSYLACFYPLDAYAGLSGALNALLVVALFDLCQRPHYRTAAMLTLVASMVKIIFEMTSSVSVFSSLAWPAVPQAHLAGWVAGVVYVLFKTLGSNHRYMKRVSPLKQG